MSAKQATRLVQALRAHAPEVAVATDAGQRGAYAYDASNYRLAPLAVAFPRGGDEVAALLRACRAAGVAVTVRGAGTSMAGNAIGAGLVIDVSRHMNRIVSIDPGARRAVVEPGVVLDALCAAAAEHGLTFGPDPSSRSRATIGGMIGNDACGNHSVRHGRTVAHVESLDVVLADGTRARADRDGLHADEPGGRARVAGLDADLRALARVHLADIRLELGRLPRQVSGYQLQHLLPESGFDVARALVGSEGTCAVVVAATVQLVPTAPAALLVALGYDDVVAAAADVPDLLAFDPAAVEGMDEAIVATMRARRGHDAVRGLPTGRAWLFVDLDGDDPATLAVRAERLVDDARRRGRVTGARLVTDPVERRSLWRVREDGAGLAARLVDDAGSAAVTAWPGWEDAAVAPDRLADYLRDFRALMVAHGRTGVMYGHFGAGCVHVRLDFDLATTAGVSATRTFLHDAARLVVAHGGSLSGEHGDGRARSELLAVMYSSRMLVAFAAYKHAWDPDGMLNPGVITHPAPLDADLAHTTVTPTTTAGAGFEFGQEPHGFASAVGRCIGVGRCRSNTGGFMCPSYRATGEERDSTRGRARLLQEMLRGDVITGGWRSPEVRDALDLCLSCRACSRDCPAGVDMATYKAEFLHQHYRRRLRPRSHYSLGWLPLWAALAGLAPGPVNAVAGQRLAVRLLARLGGVSPQRRLPRFAGRRAAAAAADVPPCDAPGLDTVSPGAPAVLFLDTFTRAFRPELAGAAARVLGQAGTPVAARDGLCCGLTWISTGQLGVAKTVLRRTVRHLDSPGDERPIIVAEPSCAAALRIELPELLDSDAARRVAARVRTFAQAITERLDAGWRPPGRPAAALLQTHCHEYAVFGATQRDLLRRLGATPVESNGCCGLAGNFGFEREHYELSQDVAELSLAPRLRQLDHGQAVLADGFSCQLQIAHLTRIDGRARHLAEVLAETLPPAAGARATAPCQPTMPPARRT